MMISIPWAINLPLCTDHLDGVIRVGETRVMLITIVQRHILGDTPEEIQEGFPTVALADIYMAIAYYIAHQAEVDTYIAQELAEAEQNRQGHESNDPSVAAFYAKLRALRDAKREIVRSA